MTIDSFIFTALPYIALALLLFVTPFRYLYHRLNWSAFSTELLERKLLYWGSNPWHYGIIPILLAHLVCFLFPGWMQRFLGNQETLLILESVGLGLGLLALLGIFLLLLRRVNTPKLRRVNYAADWLILFLLLVQTGTGVFIASFLRWGSQWYLHTAVPYFRSIWLFNPQIGFVSDLPPVFKLHALFAFLIFAVVPFTKLVHLLFLPLNFLKDPPIVYRWRAK
ncbi:MAG TPA: respiratory nitrate reductase subunit gamma [Geomonas sp.]|nr:respiratory nitrate reductase subunit gamma [Geomonas sp.]